MDDYRNTYNGAGALGSLTPGGSQPGVAESAYDDDFFAVSLTLGKTYGFTLTGNGAGALPDYNLTLVDDSGFYVAGASNFGAGTVAEIVYTATREGTFYFNAGGAYSTSTGTYVVAATTGFFDDYADAFNSTLEPLGSIAQGDTKTGSIETAGDKDLLAVSLAAGTTYTFTLKGNGAGSLGDFGLELQDASGAYLSSVSAFSADGATLVHTPNATGTFYLKASGAYSTTTGGYTLAIPGSLVDDFRDVYNDANEPLGSIALGGTKTGVVEIEGDKDIFAASLVAGTTYTFTLKGNGAKPLADFGLELQDASGAYLNSVSAFTADGATFTYTLQTTGTFYLKASGAYSSTTGGYTLSIPDSLVDDFRDIYDDAREALGGVTVGGEAGGRIELADDDDVFAVTLNKGLTYFFDVKGKASGSGTLADTSVAVLDGAGIQQISDSNPSGDSRVVFTAEADGIHYLSASGAYSTSTGTYKAAVSDGYRDDFRDTYDREAEALGAVGPGGTAGGRLEISGDRDVFAVDLVAGRTYSFDLKGVANGGGPLADPGLTLFSGKGVGIGSGGSLDGTADDRITFTADTSGTYYLVAASGTAGGTGSYTLSASPGTLADDFRDTVGSTSEPLGTLDGDDGTRTGSIEAAGDRDIFGVRLEKGGNYTFGLEAKSNGGKALADTYFRLLDASGKAIFVNDDFNGDNSRIIYSAAQSGVYYLEASSRNAGGTGNYSVWGYSDYDDVRDSTKSSGEGSASVKINGTRSGAIEAAGDRDVFGVSLTAGRSYTFDLRADGLGGRALSDVWLSLLDASGRALFANDDFNGDDARIVFTAAKSGTYYLEARAANSGGFGSYSLGAKLAYDDTRDSVKSGNEALGRLSVNKSCAGTLETRGDKDIFAVSLSAGKSYTFDLSGSKLAAAALADAYLRLLDASGKALRINDDFNGDDARIVFTAAKSGTYYLEASGNSGAFSGSYKLSAKAGYDDLADSITDPTAPLGRLAVGAKAFGTIEADRDSDVFRFSLKAGHTYSLGVDGGAAVGQLRNSELQLFDKAGTLLAVNDDAKGTVDPEIVFTADTSGTYYLDVTAIKHATGTYAVELFDLG